MENKDFDAGLLKRMEADCVGCGVCAAICPSGGVRMRLNQEGYFTAAFTEDCIRCGRCAAICPARKRLVCRDAKRAAQVWYAFNRDDGTRYVSSSGGVSSALAETALEMGYRVIGAAYDTESHRVRHILIEDKRELARIIGSKYLPSDTVSAFQRIGGLSKAAVFGTPCQIQALRKAFPKKDMLLVDFRCFGPANYRLWDKYLAYIRTINDSGIQAVNMRSKFDNWLRWGMEIRFSNGGVYRKNKLRDPFCLCFNELQFGVWEKCAACNTLLERSYADIRMEDAWNLLQFASGRDMRMGASQVNVYTEKGEAFWREAQGRLKCRQVDLKYADHFGQRAPFKKEPYERLTFTDTPLESVIRDYDRRRSPLARLYEAGCNLLLYNRFLYLQAKNAVKFFRKLRRKGTGRIGAKWKSENQTPADRL
ncbi:MAG: Coenzyme F420 hydrogenase/dehydrogenase, beta subunit C-terminal domain [Oscillospiraceae bacterium]|nr:Coenzyme F420 hydrogenase/dehydrogenase, beta subunit C-terminal domain [Oscillospiraceae bacterium]